MSGTMETRTRTVSPVRSARRTLARGVGLVGRLVAGLIVAGILLVVLDANPRNDIVEWVTDAARWLAGPFHGLFSIDSRELRIAVNWGLAAVAYFTVTGFLARLLAR
jgi:hypothetical protein